MKFRDRMAQFMIGRNGNDQLNQFLMILCAVFILLVIFTSGALKRIFNILFLVLIILAYFRMLSRDTYKRQAENTRYLQQRYRLFGKLKTVKEQWVQRKDYKFFKCPS